MCSIPFKEEGLKFWYRTFIAGEVPFSKINFCERFLELMIDIEAQLPTRRFFNVLLEDCHLVVKCQLSNLCKRSEGKLFGQVIVKVTKWCHSVYDTDNIDVFVYASNTANCKRFEIKWNCICLWKVKFWKRILKKELLSFDLDCFTCNFKSWI